MLFRRFLPKVAATLADKKVTQMAAAADKKASPSIFRPVYKIESVCI